MRRPATTARKQMGWTPSFQEKSSLGIVIIVAVFLGPPAAGQSRRRKKKPKGDGLNAKDAKEQSCVSWILILIFLILNSPGVSSDSANPPVGRRDHELRRTGRGADATRRTSAAVRSGGRKCASPWSSEQAVPRGRHPRRRKGQARGGRATTPRSVSVTRRPASNVLQLRARFAGQYKAWSAPNPAGPRKRGPDRPPAGFACGQRCFRRAPQTSSRPLPRRRRAHGKM